MEVLKQVVQNDKINHIITSSGYSFDDIKKSVQEQKNINTIMSIFNKRMKNDSTSFLIDIIKRYQNSIIINGNVILLDGPVDINLKSQIRQCNKQRKLNGEKYKIDNLSMISLNKLYFLASNILQNNNNLQNNLQNNNIPNSDLEYNNTKLNFSSINIPQNFYNYHNYDNYDRNIQIEINLTTMRPIMPSKDNLTELYGPENKWIKAGKYFTSYVKKNKSFPTSDKFLLFIWNKTIKKWNNLSLTNYPTLPICIKQIVDNIINDYTNAFNKYEQLHGIKMSPELFLSIYNSGLKK